MLLEQNLIFFKRQRGQHKRRSKEFSILIKSWKNWEFANYFPVLNKNVRFRLLLEINQRYSFVKVLCFSYESKAVFTASFRFWCFLFCNHFRNIYKLNTQSKFAREKNIVLNMKKDFL